VSEAGSGAFAGDPARKAALLATIERHIGLGTLRPGLTAWDGTGGTPLGVVVCGSDAADYTAQTGYPLALAELLDPLFSMLNGEEASRFAREWLAVVAPGADLSGVPTRIVLSLLPDGEPLVDAIIDLHRSVLEGESVARGTWSAARKALLAALDQEPDGPRRLNLALAEAASWPATTSRSILTAMADIWCSIPVAAENSDWTEADEDRAQTVLKSLWDEQRAARETGVHVDYPALFAERDGELARRFETNLALANSRYQERRRALAAIALSHLAATTPGADNAAAKRALGIAAR
jgi:hypothetical protein